MHIPKERVRAVVYHGEPFMIPGERKLMKFEAHAF